MMGTCLDEFAGYLEGGDDRSSLYQLDEWKDKEIGNDIVVHLYYNRTVSTVQ